MVSLGLVGIAGGVSLLMWGMASDPKRWGLILLGLFIGGLSAYGAFGF